MYRGLNNSNNKVPYFHKLALITWGFITILLIAISGYFFYANNNPIIRNTENEMPGILKWLCFTWMAVVTYVLKNAIRKNSTKDKQMLNYSIGGMGLSILLLACMIFIVNIERKEKTTPLSLLYRDGIIKNNPNYSIVKLDTPFPENANIPIEKRIKIFTSMFSQNNSEIGKCFRDAFVKETRDNTNLAKLIIDELRDRRYLYIQEDEINVGGVQNLSVTMSITRDTFGMTALMQDAVNEKYCLENAIQNLVFQPLQEAGTVSFSLTQILIHLNDNCSQNSIVRSILSKCEGSVTQCDGIYFQSGGYALSNVSKQILECFFRKLNTNNLNSIKIVFHGYTDSNPVGSIPYNGNAQFAPLFTLLSEGSTKPLGQITTNDQLSFARSYSALEYVKNGINDQRNIALFYTGCGVSVEGSELQQRSVKIIINK
jgi:outer membrane protein OmpA-like peptidoglycan-associated protein